MPFLGLRVRVLNDIEGHGHQCKIGEGSWRAPTGLVIQLLGAGWKGGPRWRGGPRGPRNRVAERLLRRDGVPAPFFFTNEYGNISIFLTSRIILVHIKGVCWA